MSGEIPVTGAAVVALTTSSIITISFCSWLLTSWTSAHEGAVYRAPGNFTNSSQRLSGVPPVYHFVWNHLVCVSLNGLRSA